MRSRVGVVTLALLASAPLAFGQGLATNSGFETLDASGWTEWSAPWSQGPVYDYASPDAYEGDAALYQSASSGSFGVYQEICVEPDELVELEWAWRGASNGNGWWEFMVIDGPFTYEAADDPANHPETTIAEKWETGFGGGLPEPAIDWQTGAYDIFPTSDVVTVVLKCGSTEGGLVEAWFDDILVEHDSLLLEITGVEPAMGGTGGGDVVRVSGRVFPPDATITLGESGVDDAGREGTCALFGTTRPNEADVVDVIVETGDGRVTLEDAFRFVPAPTVAVMTPATGPAEGGTAVVIEGAAFVAPDASGVRVTVGGAPLENLVVVDENRIEGTTPAGDPGVAEVIVETPFGQATVEGGFSYGGDGAALFVRGDCDGSGEINITDGVAVLGYLFLGGQTPPCLDACDADDGGLLNLTDGVQILNFLFLGGAPIAPPHPDCGSDTGESITCEAATGGCS